VKTKYTMYVLLVLQIHDAVPDSVFPQFASKSILMFEENCCGSVCTKDLSYCVTSQFLLQLRDECYPAFVRGMIFVQRYT